MTVSPPIPARPRSYWLTDATVSRLSRLVRLYGAIHGIRAHAEDIILAGLDALEPLILAEAAARGIDVSKANAIDHGHRSDIARYLDFQQRRPDAGDIPDDVID